jgi:putative addiction module killer protein
VVTEGVIQKLVLENGKVPFDHWFESLGDLKMQVAVDSRLARVRVGHFGDCKNVGAGVFELRINAGPGLRIYFGEYRKQIIVLLGGGDKSTQARDIQTAQRLWRQWLQFYKHAT